MLAEDAQVGVEVIRRSAGVGMVEAEHPTAPLEGVLAWIAGGGAPTALEAEYPTPADFESMHLTQNEAFA